ncbi:hypothetical protein BGZ96_001916 [Linnemannia gamsii]|uniref:Uncharacterized protein n=1 Tax=Linnemannia gamsii TaxID=64522 RepID=A0ABQ7KAG1_9FUNG|nr:hypothetical protein BGZ96_001916 [Linnemannia gamsii]
MEDFYTTARRLYTTLSTSLLTTIESHPLLLMTLQYATAASRAATIYLLSVIWTLAQSFIWMVTAEGLDWIQSREFGPLILEWDSFLFGAVFLTVDIHPDSLEFHHAKNASCVWSSSEGKQHSRSSSRSSSLNNGGASGRRVTFFDEQVMVLGRSGAVGGQQQQQRGITPILINNNSCNSYSYIQDPHGAPIMTESPTRSTFAISSPSAAPYCPSLSQEAEYLQRNYGYSYSNNYQYQYQYTDSPSSSRSNSCRSSICSVSSSESIESSSSSDSAVKPTASSTKSHSSSSSRLAALFHHTPRHTSTVSHSPPTSSASSINSSNAQPSISGTTKSKNLVHRIMHPQKHKREVELQHQIELQQQQQQQPYYIPEFLDAMMENEYQPSEHTRKSLKQRLGLNKKKSQSF